jgi:hypothetical protein
METIQKAPLASLFNQEPCEDGAAFLEGFDNPQAAWDACQRPDWMCWAMTQLGKGEDTRLRDAAREIALSVFALHFKREDESVSVVFRYLETGDETLRSVAESAAWSAASAAESAAWSAAESVESAAWSAAKSAAWSAAWSAESAAWSAASAAESAAESVARSAAKSAAWSAESAAWSAASAAESAAESVARSAASAAESAACDIIRKHIPNPLEH